jgi:hypothetical protein
LLADEAEYLLVQGAKEDSSLVCNSSPSERALATSVQIAQYLFRLAPLKGPPDHLQHKSWTRYSFGGHHKGSDLPTIEPYQLLQLVGADVAGCQQEMDLPGMRSHDEKDLLLVTSFQNVIVVPLKNRN